MEHLYCTLADSRTIFGQTTYNAPSRFLGNIPGDLLELVDCSEVVSGAKEVRWTQADATAHPAAPERRRPPADATADPAAQAIVTQALPRESSGFRAGDRVRHNTFGEGMVLATQGSGDQAKVTVHFQRVGVKTIVLAYAPLEKL